ncbi:MAG: Acetyltransferase (isoleucine patch superfamily)-like protein [Frankiales bacterium]|nr:Acetyltransferase (isoleucine patch superfamily)-like protein [Frankiales bacterium]
MSSYELAGSVVRRSQPFARKVRRALLVRRIQVLAAAAGATVDVEIALEAVIGRGIRVEVEPGTHSSLRIGPGTLVGDDVVLELRGGSTDIGPWCDLRRGTVLKVSGRLTMGQQSTLGAGTTVHCAYEVTIGDRVGIAEDATLVDSSHRPSEAGKPMFHDTIPGAVRIGDDVFVGSKATLTRKCVIGDYCVIGAGSVVIGEVPSRAFFSGVPATFVAPVELPWE